jgi:hypothetical protein
VNTPDIVIVLTNLRGGTKTSKIDITGGLRAEVSTEKRKSIFYVNLEEGFL